LHVALQNFFSFSEGKASEGGKLVQRDIIPTEMTRLEDSENPTGEANFVTIVHSFRYQGFQLTLKFVDKFSVSKSLQKCHMMHPRV
jgi:hypothetical protein